MFSPSASATSSSCSPKPPFSDVVASVALMLVWIAVLGPIPLLIIWTKWGIDAEGTHIHNINKSHLHTNTHWCTHSGPEHWNQYNSEAEFSSAFTMHAQDDPALNIETVSVRGQKQHKHIKQHINHTNAKSCLFLWMFVAEMHSSLWQNVLM